MFKASRYESVPTPGWCSNEIGLYKPLPYIQGHASGWREGLEGPTCHYNTRRLFSHTGPGGTARWAGNERASVLSAAVCVQHLPLWILSNFRLIEEADLIGVKSVGHSHGNVSW